MNRDEELYWRNQPEWSINAEMEVRLKRYFEQRAEEQKFNEIENKRNIEFNKLARRRNAS